jgi:predicted 3-demethylubiquinone-9 3-methyltransferase (glyoxalase superfamily)
MFEFTPAISMFVNCDTQGQIDYYWDKLSEDGTLSRCGWLQDKFGLSWQVVPAMLPSVLGGPDPAGSKRAMQAMLSMVKLEIAALQAAYDGK